MDNKVEITEAELDSLYGEIDKLSPKFSANFTDIQMKAIGHALGRDLSWATILNWFNVKYGTCYKKTTFREKYLRELK